MITAQNLLGRWGWIASRAAARTSQLSSRCSGARFSQRVRRPTGTHRRTDVRRTRRTALSPSIGTPPIRLSALLAARLERRDLVVDLRAVVEVVLVLAGSLEEELDAV